MVHDVQAVVAEKEEILTMRHRPALYADLTTQTQLATSGRLVIAIEAEDGCDPICHAKFWSEARIVDGIGRRLVITTTP